MHVGDHGVDLHDVRQLAHKAVEVVHGQLVVVARPGAVRPRGSEPGLAAHGPRQHRDVGRQALCRGQPGVDDGFEARPQHVHAVAAAGGHGQHLDVEQAVATHQAPKVGEAGPLLGGAQTVDLVENHQHDRPVLGERGQVLLVQQRIGVLDRVGDPDDDVHQADEAVDLDTVLGDHRVVVGQVEQHEPVQRVRRVVQRALPGHPSTCRHGQPVEQRVGVHAAPDARQRDRRRRTSHPGLGQVEPGEGVEQRRLARAGRPGQRDHGEVEPEARALAGARLHRLDVGHRLGADEAAQQHRGLGQRLQSSVQRGLAHAPTSTVSRCTASVRRPATSSGMRPSCSAMTSST